MLFEIASQVLLERHVIRGLDLLDSTGRQVQLARRLGRVEPPAYLHHPLILDADGRKLSKRDRATGIGELRAAGTPPDVVLGRAACAVGLVPAPIALPADALPDLFDRWG